MKFLYLVLLSVVEVISNALDSELLFADPAGSRMVPVDKWAENFINPLIGAGLLFLLGRDLMHEARGGNPILFSTLVLVVLFSVTVVGIAVELAYSRRRGSKVKLAFAKQVAESLEPLSYTYTRHEGKLELQVSSTMKDFLEQND